MFAFKYAVLRLLTMILFDVNGIELTGTQNAIASVITAILVLLDSFGEKS